MEYVANESRYDTMRYNRCGKSGLKLSALSLGMWHNFGDTNAFENSRQMMLGAFDQGITSFDLANNYGPPSGASEEVFGRVITSDLKQHRDEIVVSTKAGYYMWPGPYGEWGSKKSLISSLDQSLKRMKVDYVDIFYHHRPDPETPLEETAEALAMMVHQGKALYLGVSNYSGADTKKMNDLLKEKGLHLLISEPRYSMLNRLFETDQQQVLLDEGIGALAFCPLAEGLLTSKYFNGIPQDSRAASASIFLTSNSITPERIEIAKKLNEIAQQRGQSLAQFALVWALHNPAMTSVIIGASRLSQIDENVGALKNLSISVEEASMVEEILKNNEPFF